MAGARILVRGEIKKAEQKEDTLTLMLEQVTAEAGRRTAKFRRIVVYVDNGAKGKSDSGFREALTAGFESTGEREAGSGGGTGKSRRI